MDEEAPRGKRGEDFDWVELIPERTLLRDLGFRIFLVQVKSELAGGKRLHNDPLEFFRTEIPEMGIPAEDVHATLLRANAEHSANPRHRSEVWMVYPTGSTTAVGVQYKHTDYPPEQS